MITDNYLPLSYLNAWEYCPRRFYLEYELGETQDNEHIILGRYLHENINQEGTIKEGNTLIHRQQWVWSENLQISGIIDAVEQRDNQLIPLEYKKGKMAQHLNDHFQLCAAALCLEERTGKEISFGEIFYHGNRRRQKVMFTSQLREMTTAAIYYAQKTAINKKMPAPIDHKKKCQACSLINICMPLEIKQLLQEGV